MTSEVGNIPSLSVATELYAPTQITTSLRLTRSVNASETEEVYVTLITISHPQLEQDIRVSNDPTQMLPEAEQRGTISNGLEYIFIPFEFVLPNMEADAPSRAKIRLDNISRELSATVDSITGDAPIVNAEVVLASSPDVVEFSIYDFQLRKVEYDVYEISGELAMEYFESEPFPAGSFNPSGWTGLFRG